jgi:leader peptidase (prepilin peptidase) / N-methyltransferase
VEIFEIWPVALLIVSALLGLIVGSFLNVVAFRVPIMMELAWRTQLEEARSDELFEPPPHVVGRKFNLMWPRSECPKCGATIAAWQNIPVLSYLLLRGSCAHCKARISLRYPIVEAAVAAVTLVVAWVFGPTWQTAAALFFTWTLVALTLIDFDHKLLPDTLTLPLMWVGIVLALFDFGGVPLFTDLRSSVIGAVAGYLSLWSVYQLFKLATGKEGMGYGDFKLLAAIGAWAGWQLLPLVILLSALVGAVVGIALIVFGGRSRHTAIPFGPYLAAAGWIALLWGEGIVAWYQRLMI